ncbi:MAG: hypothetical protein NT077_00365 [Candidatus Taylorbacteria bacterium]|nr:hypothetical protein [Candidatus Taylorbacteria bacterium]
MNAYYLNRTGSIPMVLQRRRAMSSQVRSQVNSFVESKYGIEDFTALVHSYLPAKAQQAIAEGQSVGLLARQVPGICAEDMGMYLLSKKLGLFPLALSFTRDTFVGVNHDKRHRVTIPWVKWSSKGNPVTTYEDVSEDGLAAVERMRLDAIRVKGGGFLPEYHERLRHQVFNGSYAMGDVSRLHGELLARATRSKPVETYRVINGKDQLVKGLFTTDEARNLTVRPTSHWYYPLYLSWFACGSMVLLDTYENPDGGVPEAKRLFEQTMDELAEAYSWMPLVIQTAPLCLDMMFCNRALLETPDAAEILARRVKLWHVTTYDASRYFADEAVTFRGS